MPPGSGGYPALPPGSGGYPALPPGSGGYPAVPPGSGGYPAVPSPSGGYPAAPPGSGGYPAVSPGSGGYPAVAPPTGNYPAAREPSPSGRYPAAPRTGAHPAVRPSQRYAPPSGQGHVLPSGGDKVPSGLDLVSPVGQMLPSPSADPKPFGRFPHIGERFDGYELLELLGQGNMGKIYKARDSANRSLAMKVILKEVATEEGLARFQREGEALASIPWHKNVVQVHSTGTIRGMPYLTMDFVEGQSLEDFLREGPLPLKQAGIVAEKLGRALHHVHSAGVMHRDLKPANILIRNDNGEPVLTDFGLAGMTGAQSLTQTGDLLGTPLYMAPEQVLGLNKSVDKRADVWGLGVLLYEMATGAVPFPGTSMVEVCSAITGKTPLPITELCPEADAALAAIVHRALAKEREHRYQTPGEMADDLKAWRRARKAGTPLPPPPPPPSSSKRLLIAVGALAVVGALLGTIAIVKGTRAKRATGTVPEQGSGDDVPTVAVERTPGERALAEAKAAVQRGDLDRATEVLALRELRGELKGHPGVAQLRSGTIARALELTQTVEPRPKQVRLILNLLHVLNQLSEEPPGPELADAMLVWATEADKNGAERLTERTVGLVQGLAHAGARPSVPAATMALDEYLYFGRTRDYQNFQGRYYRLLLAMVRMDIPLGMEHLRGVGWGGWKAKPSGAAQDPRETFLRLRLRYFSASMTGGSERERLRVFNEIKLFSRETSAKSLGPCNRAMVLMFIVHIREQVISDPEALLKEAIEIAPGYVELRLFLAKRRFEQARRLFLAKNAHDAALELAKGGLEHATIGLKTIETDGYDASGPLGATCFAMRKAAVRLYTLVGNDAAAEHIVATLPETRANRSAQLEELRAVRNEAKSLRADPPGKHH